MIGKCGVWFAKHVLCLFNFLCFIFGTVLLGIGIWLALDKASLIALIKIVKSESVIEFTQPHIIEQFALVLIVVAGVTFFLSFLGYCGTMCESRSLLVMYGVLMILLFIAELVGGGLGAFYKDKVEDETKSFLQSTINRYYSTPDHLDAITVTWNGMMAELGCCGIDNYHDFEKSAWYESRGNRTIPETCCILDDVMHWIPRDKTCVTNPTEFNSFYNQGCYELLVDWINRNRYIIIGVLLGIAGVHLITICLAFLLCKAYSKYHGMHL